MADVGGFDEVSRNLKKVVDEIHRKAARASGMIAALLEGYAKTHHGDHPRAAGWVYPGGGRRVKVSNMYFKAEGENKARIGAGSYYRRTRRWREAGTGWGDVTSNTNTSITGSWERLGEDLYRIALSAGMDYDLMLETARNGRWAWLWPTMLACQDQMREIWRKELSLG